VSRREIKRNRGGLATEIGSRGSGPRITPPRIPDERLASESQAGERFNIARVVGERGEAASTIARRLAACSNRT
jgi:hypothetical protein